jgi:hypothetical protein
MRICRRCEIEKPITEFYTYYHTTQNCYRTRHICNTCKYEDKIRLRQKKKEMEMDWLNNSKICSHCGERKATTYFYNSRSQCKTCVLIFERERRLGQNNERLEENGGSERVPQTVGVFADIYQKRQTEQLLKILGWEYSTENKLWYKAPYNDANGVWYDIKTGKPLVKKKNKEAIKDFYATVDESTLPKFKSGKKGLKIVKEDEVNKLLHEHFIGGLSRFELGKKYNLKPERINYYIRTILEEATKK